MRLQNMCLALILSGVAITVSAQGSSSQSGAGQERPGGGGQSSQQGGSQVGSQQGGAQGGGQQGGQRPPRPPREAVDACQGKASGAACSFVGRENQSLAGTCFAPPAKGDRDKGPPPLACRPANHGQGGGQGGPGGQGGAGKGASAK